MTDDYKIIVEQEKQTVMAHYEVEPKPDGGHQSEARLEAELGREPRLSELSAVLGICEAEISACDLAGAPVQSLQHSAAEDGPMLENALGDAGIEDAITERGALRKALDEAVAHKDKNFGNARYVRNVFEKAIQEQANRVSTLKNATARDLTEITIEDIQKAL